MHITVRGKKHFDIKNNLISISKINESLSCNILTTENNVVLDFAMPVTIDMMTFTVSICIRDCFSFPYEQTKCNLGNLVGFLLKYLLFFSSIVFPGLSFLANITSKNALLAI